MIFIEVTVLKSIASLYTFQYILVIVGTYHIAVTKMLAHLVMMYGILQVVVESNQSVDRYLVYFFRDILRLFKIKVAFQTFIKLILSILRDRVIDKCQSYLFVSSHIVSKLLLQMFEDLCQWKKLQHTEFRVQTEHLFCFLEAV